MGRRKPPKTRANGDTPAVAEPITSVLVGELIPATVVLVHGNFLGPWSWSDVTEILASAQVSAKTVRLPSSTTDGSGPRGDLYEDARHVRAVLDSLRGPVVLCGHSYGGAVITEAVAGPHPAVRRLVYLTGAVPDVGESLASLASAEESDGAAEAALPLWTTSPTIWRGREALAPPPKPPSTTGG